LYGTPKTSFENVGTARLRILHTESVNPDVRGSRARHINAIYVENAQGERFRLQSNKLPGARAIARHISEGGTPWDEVGQHINSMLQEMTDLSTFVRGMRRRTFEDGVATKMVEAAVAHYGNLHKQLNNLKSPRAYKTFVENFEPQAQQLDEVDLNELKERFVKKIFDDRMTAALPHVYKAYQLQEQYKQTQIQSIKQVIEGQAVLTLSTNEGMDEYMKMLRFQDTGSLVKSVLEDIATRAVTTMPEVADFASHWAKNYDTITETASEDILESQALAVQLATHYLRDLRNLKENTSLRIQVQRDETDLDPGPDLLGEGTMHYPRTPEELQAFQQVLSQPIPFGMDATNVTSVIGDLLFDDELFDRLGNLSDDLGEQADAVPAIKEWLKDNWPGLYEKLGLGNQEIDTPAVAPTQPPAPTPQTTAAAPAQNPVGLSEELKQMLRIAGLAK
jgi:hypothetical protein